MPRARVPPILKDSLASLVFLPTPATILSRPCCTQALLLSHKIFLLGPEGSARC